MKALTLSISGVIVVLLFLGIYYLSQPPLKALGSTPISFRIVPSMGLTEIAAILQKNNLIRSRQIFEIYSLLSGKADRLQPGEYAVQADTSLSGLVDILSIGPKDVKFVVAPGMTIAEIDEKLSALGVIKSGELASLDLNNFVGRYPWLTNFIKSYMMGGKVGVSPEGFVLPDTYNLSSGKDAGTTLSQFLDNFQTKALPLFQNNPQAASVLVTASLLEKEAPGYHDRQLIAGILGKRIQEKMPLQVDATVIYAECGGKFTDCPEVSSQDYKINSPYNTYIYTGLPPGPIANPGLDAIKAALNPLKSDYLYYLSNPQTKKTIFSTTFDEHDDARAKYLLTN